MPKQKKLWSVERILDSRVTNNVKEYLVKWHNFSPNQNTWEPRSSFQNTFLIDLFDVAEAQHAEARSKKSMEAAKAIASKKKKNMVTKPVKRSKVIAGLIEKQKARAIRLGTIQIILGRKKFQKLGKNSSRCGVRLQKCKKMQHKMEKQIPPKYAGLTVDKIFAWKNNKFHVKFNEKFLPEPMPRLIANKWFPQAVISFYEEHLKWE